MHTFQPRDPIEVETIHGRGIVLWVTIYGAFANDIWTIAIKSDGQIRHYQTIQLKLSESGVLGMNEKPILATNPNDLACQQCPD